MALACLLIAATALVAMSTSHAHQEPQSPNKARTQYTAHDPIIIYSEDDLASSDAVTGGSGTAQDPYVISGWEITTEQIGGCIFLWRTTSHYVIRDCHIHTPDAVCIEVQDAPNGTIENCVVDAGSIGIFVTNCPNTNITGNTVTNMTTLGICAAGSTWVNVTGNNATDNEHFGLALEFLGNSTCSDNFVSDTNGTGIDVFSVAGSVIVRNNVSGNNDGIRITNSDSVQVRSNSIVSNRACGLNLSGSTNISIYHNWFIGNAVQASQDIASSGIMWDNGYPSGGNYWSDYAGLDVLSGPFQNEPGSDGIGDSPHTTSAGATDRYPFASSGAVPVPEFELLIIPVASLMAVFLMASRSRQRRHTI